MGKGLGSKQVPPHAGISADLRMLYKLFKEADSVRLRDFQTAFRAANMEKTWFGRQSAAELLEYSERLLHMSATYMFSSRTVIEQGINSVVVEHSLLERIFGIYCCYAFYFLQPTDYVARIRVTPTEMEDLQKFVQNGLIPERHLDAAACVAKLTDAAAFRVQPFKQAYDPACHKRYDVPDVDDDIGEVREQPFTILSKLAVDPLLKQLSLVHKKYEAAKRACAPMLRPGKDLLEEVQSLVTKAKMEAAASLKSRQSKLPDDLAWTEEADASADRSLKNRLKDKAYTSNIKHSRNRRYADPNMKNLAENDEEESPKVRRKRHSMVIRGQSPAGDNHAVMLPDAEESMRGQADEQKQVVPMSSQSADAQQKKKPTPLQVLSDPLAAAASRNRNSLPPVNDNEFQQVLQGFKDSSDAMKVESQLNQLLEGGSPTKGQRRARTRRSTAAK